jgi:UDP-glucose 4-epimerase
MTKQPTVVISGANGYFGGIACHFFAQQGWTVLKATRSPDADVALDLDQPEQLAAQSLTTQADLFIHAAAAHEVTCRDEPYRSVRQNVVGTKAALDFCVANGIPKFVYLSTFHVFGSPTETIDEQVTPLPANDYGLSHLQAEDYVQLYTRIGKLQGLVLRPSNFFGIPVDLQACKRWTLTPLAFCREAIEQKRIVLKTPGWQQRNFISVLDICGVIQSAIATPPPHPILHLAGPDTLSIRGLAQLVQRVMAEQLQEQINLEIPDGEPGTADFHYTSRYLGDLYHPKHRIETFIIDFCKTLSRNAL